MLEIFGTRWIVETKHKKHLSPCLVIFVLITQPLGSKFPFKPFKVLICFFKRIVENVYNSIFGKNISDVLEGTCGNRSCEIAIFVTFTYGSLGWGDWDKMV